MFNRSTWNIKINKMKIKNLLIKLNYNQSENSDVNDYPYVLCLISENFKKIFGYDLTLYKYNFVRFFNYIVFDFCETNHIDKLNITDLNYSDLNDVLQFLRNRIFHYFLFMDNFKKGFIFDKQKFDVIYQNHIFVFRYFTKILFTFEYIPNFSK